MAKLFVAIDLPAEVKKSLIAMQPSSSKGVRPTARHQFHVTLHYIGDAQRERIADALHSVVGPEFSLSITGLGQFSTSDGGAILWAGIAQSDRLLQLHKSVAISLASEGFRAEARPYSPHVTLARCQRDRTPGVVERFLDQGDAVSVPPFSITQFVLYASEPTPDGPIYQPLQTYSLRGTVSDGAI